MERRRYNAQRFPQIGTPVSNKSARTLGVEPSVSERSTGQDTSQPTPSTLARSLLSTTNCRLAASACGDVMTGRTQRRMTPRTHKPHRWSTPFHMRHPEAVDRGGTAKTYGISWSLRSTTTRFGSSTIGVSRTATPRARRCWTRPQASPETATTGEADGGAAAASDGPAFAL